MALLLHSFRMHSARKIAQEMFLVMELQQRWVSTCECGYGHWAQLPRYRIALPLMKPTAASATIVCVHGTSENC